MRAGMRVANVDPRSTSEAGQIAGAGRVLCSPTRRYSKKKSSGSLRLGDEIFKLELIDFLKISYNFY